MITAALVRDEIIALTKRPHVSSRPRDIAKVFCRMRSGDNQLTTASLFFSGCCLEDETCQRRNPIESEKRRCSLLLTRQLGNCSASVLRKTKPILTEPAQPQRKSS